MIHVVGLWTKLHREREELFVVDIRMGPTNCRSNLAYTVIDLISMGLRKL